MLSLTHTQLPSTCVVCSSYHPAPVSSSSSSSSSSALDWRLIPPPQPAGDLHWPGQGAEEDRSMEGDDKWKFSKKGRSRSGRNYYSATDAGAGPSGLSRSCSASVSATRDVTSSSGSGSGSSQQQQQREQQQSSSRLSKKCVEAVKEHRARFYIVRRCVSMLVCWRDY